jgi:dihydroorotase
MAAPYAEFTRREILTRVGGTLAFSAPISRGALASPGKDRSEGSGPLYDLVIHGGRVVDPSQNLEARRDVAIQDGKIAAIAQEIPESQARHYIRVKEKIITPGLIDMHVHVFPYVGPFGIEPDPYCLGRGVTTVLDAGTTGAFSFAGLRKFVIERSSTRIRALLHVVSIGLIAGNTPNMGELLDLRYCDPALAVKVAGENRDLIVGFKLRFSDFLTGPNDLEALKRARSAADQARLPLMIHIGGPTTALADLLSLLKPGDVVTHSFNGHPNGILDARGKIIPAAREARERGVRFDIGHGMGSFSFEVAEKCLEQGFLPDTISSDLHAFNIHGPVFDLSTTLSKFLLLGMSLTEVVRRATVNAASTFDFGTKIGTVEPGAEADLTGLDIKEGEFTFVDAEGKSRTGKQKLVPVFALKGGKVFESSA